MFLTKVRSSDSGKPVAIFSGEALLNTNREHQYVDKMELVICWSDSFDKVVPTVSIFVCTLLRVKFDFTTVRKPT
jgi:hypothetical protein